MKQKIKDFLLKKRIKILRNKKGFSLIEVLVAVAIIGIISAIAVPQFTANKNEAAKVAVDTSAGNVAKAFKNCLALNSFSACNSLSAIKVSCPAGSQCDSGGDGTNFCAEIHKGQAGNDFKVCVSINVTSGTEIRTYGGDLVGQPICHVTETTSGTCTAANSGNEFAVTGNVSCTQADIVNNCGADVTAQGNTCGKAYACKIPTTAATCNTSNGTCS